MVKQLVSLEKASDSASQQAKSDNSDPLTNPQGNRTWNANKIDWIFHQIGDWAAANYVLVIADEFGALRNNAPLADRINDYVPVYYGYVAAVVRQRPETLMSTWKSLVREDIYLPYRQKAKSRIWESVVRDIYKQQRIEKSR